MQKVTCIAEIGINWFGDINLAKEMIDFSLEAGADIAKFQFYRPEEVLGKESRFLTDATKGALTKDTFTELKEYCDSKDMEFGCSVFHPDLIDFTESQGLKRYKIASRSVKDINLLREINATKKPVIASTGMSERGDVSRMLDILRDCQDITLLYCVCSYPTHINSINMAQLDMVRDILKHSGRPERVGFSSHCPNIVPTLVAVARGANTVENHIVKYKSMKGCDVSSSLTFNDFKRMVKYIRDMENLNG